MELTADLDVNFVGSVANVVMAAVSAPIGGGGTGGASDEGSVKGVLEENGNTGGTRRGRGLGGLLFGPGGAGGALPFTGYPLLAVGAIGAALAGIGATLRSMFRRRPRR